MSFSPGALAVADGLVVGAGFPADASRVLPAGSEKVELPGLAILPGLVNAHTHLSIPRLSGPEGAPAPSSLPFVEWILRLVAWRRSAPPGEFAKNVENAARESISGGTTGVGEIGGPDIDAYAALPLRARIFAEGIGFFPEVAGTVLSSVEEAVSRIAGFSREGGTILPGISPHTLYTVGEDLLKGLSGLASRLRLPLALHLAESPAEMEFLSSGGGQIAARLYPAVGRDVSFFRGLGAPVPSYLKKTGILRSGLLLVHNVHLPRPEIDELRAGGAGFVLCPRSNAAHRNGSPDVTHLVDAGIPVALGTDSLGSVATLDLWDEMRQAASLYRGDLPGEEVCRSLFRAATENGARLLGLPSGALTAGAPADFIAIDDPCPEGAGWEFSRMVERVGDRDVRLTVVAGERIHERP